MASMHDRQYYADRADQENDLGDRAATPKIAAIHYELAYRYALMADECREDVIPLILKLA